ncbi:GFA family protein [Serratia marcescens]
MSFQGSCHCGAVTFSVDAELPTEALSCNCSICRRKGLLLSFFPISAFTLNSGQDRSAPTPSITTRSAISSAESAVPSPSPTALRRTAPRCAPSTCAACLTLRWMRCRSTVTTAPASEIPRFQR